MKIAIGYKMEDGPYGGGNSVIRSLARYLPEHGHEVVWSLEDEDIDFIILVDPRLRSPNIPFSAGAALCYLAFQNPEALVIQQIHDCDERKGTNNMNRRQRIANYAADHAVCVGSWMLALDVVRPEHAENFSVILNGGETDVFHAEDAAQWDGKEPLRLVTHHWGANWMKGFDVYGMLDELLGDPSFRALFEFTYIGNVPAGFHFDNAIHLQPLAGEALASELRQHHAYITASINEPAGLHHIEGAMCGLPPIYRNSGALPEYCDGFGIRFEDVDDVVPTIERMRREYHFWRDRLSIYDRSERRMVNDYHALFIELDKRRTEIVAQRRVWRNPMLFALNQVPF